MNVQIPQREIEINGLSGGIRIEDLFRFRSAPHQRLEFDRAAVGRWFFTAGRCEFQTESPHDYFLEQAAVNWLGGEVKTHAVHFQLPDPQIDLVLYAEGIEVGRVLELMHGFDGTGSGTLYGKLPLFIRQGRIRYGNGFLYSIPGEGGNLSIRDNDFLTAALPQTSEQYERVQMVEQALRDFDFDLFRLDLKPAAQGLSSLTLRLSGRSRKTPAEVPVDLTVNLHGPLEQLLNLGLQLREMQ